MSARRQRDQFVHLTTRAVEWLKADRDPVQYKTSLARAACGARLEDLFDAYSGPPIWCRVQDVRALVRGYPTAKRGNRFGEPEQVPIERPSCPQCSVMLDALLEQTQQQRDQGFRELTWAAEKENR